MKTWILPLAALCLAACQPAPQPAPPAETAPAPAPDMPPPDVERSPGQPQGSASADQARWEGLRGARLGMDEAQLRAAWDGTLRGGDVREGSTCTHLFPVGAASPPSPAFMFEEGRLVRYEISDNAEIAPGGGLVGMQRADIMRLYRGIQASPHAYDMQGEYLRIARGENVLVFETNADGMVTHWRVGRAPQVDYVEGCS